jgi:hypothetical protein
MLVQEELRQQLQVQHHEAAMHTPYYGHLQIFLSINWSNVFDVSTYTTPFAALACSA